jgi:predicted transcriptional regulator
VAARNLHHDILTFIASRDNTTHKAIAAKFGITDSEAFHHIMALVDQGLIMVDHAGIAGITAKGREAIGS